MGKWEPKSVGGSARLWRLLRNLNGELPVPSSKPKIQAYVSDRLYQAVQEWKAQNGITGDSEAIERLLSAALNLPSDRDIPGEVLQEIYQRLDALDDRLSTLEKCQGTPESRNPPVAIPTPLTSPVAFEAQRVLDARRAVFDHRVESRIAEFRQPDMEDGISQNELARLCKCHDRKLRSLRDRPEKLAEFTLERIGQAYDFQCGRYYPVL